MHYLEINIYNDLKILNLADPNKDLGFKNYHNQEH